VGKGQAALDPLFLEAEKRGLDIRVLQRNSNSNSNSSSNVAKAASLGDKKALDSAGTGSCEINGIVFDSTDPEPTAASAASNIGGGLFNFSFGDAPAAQEMGGNEDSKQMLFSFFGSAAEAEPAHTPSSAATVAQKASKTLEVTAAVVPVSAAKEKSTASVAVAVAAAPVVAATKPAVGTLLNETDIAVAVNPLSLVDMAKLFCRSRYIFLSNFSFLRFLLLFSCQTPTVCLLQKFNQVAMLVNTLFQ
jgi:hypothetical protein